MQLLDPGKLIFGWTLAGLFLFGILYALLVRWMSRKNFQGQTAWAVVVGVAVTLAAMIPMLGLETVSVILACFAASGGPMVIEYISRVEADRAKDEATTQKVMQDLLGGKKK